MVLPAAFPGVLTVAALVTPGPRDLTIENCETPEIFGPGVPLPRRNLLKGELVLAPIVNRAS